MHTRALIGVSVAVGVIALRATQGLKALESRQRYAGVYTYILPSSRSHNFRLFDQAGQHNQTEALV